MSTQLRRSFGFGVCRGVQVWSGIVMAAIGFLLQECTRSGFDFGPFMFFGGLLLGMGVVRNRQQQDA